MSSVMRLVGLVTTVAVAAAGCSSGIAPTPEAPVTPGTAVVEVPSPAQPPLQLGQRGEAKDWKLTVRAVEDKTGTLVFAQPGAHWASADVEMCSTLSSVQADKVYLDEWTMGYAEGDPAPAIPDRLGFIQPYLPTMDKVKGGTCERGWVTFQVLDAAGFTTVQFRSNEGDGTTVIWLAP